jgi:hyperosmotically inducible protein
VAYALLFLFMGGVTMSKAVVEKLARGALLAGVLLGLAVPAIAAGGDTWITTKAKIALLTADGVKARDVNVDTVDGSVTIHGKVRTEAEKAKAESAVKGIDGVKTVRNLLQVVPESRREAVKAADSEIKSKVEAAIKDDPGLKGEDVKVASVNKGVVLLAGKTANLDQKLRAIECAAKVDGVERVATEIKTEQP